MSSESAIARLPNINRQPKLEALVSTSVSGLVESESAGSDLQNALSLENATGVWLDLLAARVGARRQQAISDEEFRRNIRGLIAADRSNGSHNSILRMLRIVLGAEGAIDLTSEAYLTAHATITESVMSQSLRNLIINLMQRAVAGGTRSLLESTDLAVEDCFALGNCGYLPSAISSGVNSLSLTYAPTSQNVGTFQLSPTLSNAETVSFVRTGDTFTFTFTCANAHDENSAVLFNTTGEGFGSGGFRRIEDRQTRGANLGLFFVTLPSATAEFYETLPGGQLDVEITSIEFSISGAVLVSGSLSAYVAEIVDSISGIVINGGVLTASVAELSFALDGSVAGVTIVDEGSITASSPTIVDEGPITAGSPTIVDEGAITGM